VPEHHLPHQPRQRTGLAARPGLDGQILSQQAAVERGRRNFGSLVGGPA
jgi:hypothetical protein